MTWNNVICLVRKNWMHLFALSWGVSWANFAMTSSMLLKAPKKKKGKTNLELKSSSSSNNDDDDENKFFFFTF